MFDLKEAVAIWSRAASAAHGGGPAREAEIADHLWCEIESARADGLSDERAFTAAVAKLGPIGNLAPLRGGTRSLRGLLCAMAAFDRRLEAAPRSGRGLLLAHAALWGAVMLASALLLPKTLGRGSTSGLLLGVIVPCWWGSDLLLRSALRSRRSGRPS